MKLGYLHAGGERHGVHRYGRMLAAAAAASGAAEVHAAELDLDHPERSAAEYDSCDVVHLQYNPAIWGGGTIQLHRLRAFAERARPPLVATLHDVYAEDPWRAWKKRPPTLRRRLRDLRDDLTAALTTGRAVRHVLRRSLAVLVCSEEERRRIAAFAHGDRVRVLPHFVEDIGLLPDRVEARRALGVEQRDVLTVLGYLHPRKGADIAVDALPLLPERTLLVCAGQESPGREGLAAELEKRARKLGVADRFRVTGWLAADEQRRWLAATDLALCPFRFFSASGSFSTWIAAGQRALCSDLPQFREYARSQPGALATFEPLAGPALAEAARQCLAEGRGAPDPAVVLLRGRISLAAVFREHLAVYREVAR